MSPWLSKKIYSFVQSVRKERVSECFNELEKSQWYSSEELRELQWRKLKIILMSAYKNVPYYQKRFAKVGIKPDDIVVPDNLLKIPILTKDDIRKYSSELIAESSTKKIIDYHTSGTTGEPLVLYFSKEHFAYSRAAQLRGFRWYDVDYASDKEGRLWGIPLNLKKKYTEKVKDFFMNRKRLSAFDLSDDRMQRYFNTCQSFKIKYLYGYASIVYTFARFLSRKGIDGKNLDLKVIVCTSEVLHDYQREVIEQAFGCPIIKEYGSAETGLIAFECPNKNIHIAYENVYLEFVDDGKHVESEQTGELLVTTLNNTVMPLIRYKLGDLCKFSNKACTCGRGLPLINEIRGRDNDVIILPDGKVIHSLFIGYIVREISENGGGIKEIKVIQKKIDKLLVLVVKDKSFSSDTETFLKSQIHKFVGEVDITLEYVDKIPREASGKIRYVVSELSSESSDKYDSP